MQEPIKGVLLEVGGVHYEIMGDAFFYVRTAHHSLLFHYYFIYKQYSANLTVGIRLITDIACTRLSLPSEVLKRYLIVFSNFMIDFRQYGIMFTVFRSRDNHFSWHIHIRSAYLHEIGSYAMNGLRFFQIDNYIYTRITHKPLPTLVAVIPSATYTVG